MITILQSIPAFFCRLLVISGCIACVIPTASATDEGYRLWLKYDRVADEIILESYRQRISTVSVLGTSPTLQAADTELRNGLKGLLGIPMSPISSAIGIDSNTVIVGTYDLLPDTYRHQLPKQEVEGLGREGYIIRDMGSCIAIVANEDIGVLYGTFHFLRLLQTLTRLEDIAISSSPRLQWRMLNHWDNLNGTVERGYAGLSIWDWETLPNTIHEHYIDYARANASIGINGVALNNVNASPEILSEGYLAKAAALADAFRPYGIRVFLSINFASPKVLGRLDTADPKDPGVQKWWKAKTEAIYRLIPDFGGFLVKANSEGQPGPQDYGRTHAEGANMLAQALDDHGGILIWRAFVYEAKGDDRVKDAYDEFVGFDGQFLSNVFVQIKNGPLDFQPREPFSPLFGAMPNTPQMMEFQITQEYLGFSTHLVYLATLYQEVLNSDTYVAGKNSTVGRVLDGSLQGQQMTGMAGVSNIGDVGNWTYHPFAQANWYALGRLAWDHRLPASDIATEWIKMTLTNNESAVQTILRMMMESHTYLVNYQSPLGLNVLSSVGHHYGPQPWRRVAFHRADTNGIGFDRTRTGSHAVAQYAPVVRDSFGDPASCPEMYLTWFHHLAWDYPVKSGRTLWAEICERYYSGVEGVRQMQREWESLAGKIHPETFQQVSGLLAIQEDEAVWWRDACLWYFARVSGQKIPEHYEEPRYNEAQLKKKEQQTRHMKQVSTAMDVP